MMDIQYRTDTREILAHGAFPTPPADPNVALATLDDAEVPKLRERGVKTYEQDGTVTVFLDPAIVQAEEEAAAARAAADAERDAAATDLRDQYQPTLAALDAIINSATALPESKTLARAQRLMLRFARAQIGG